MAIQRTWKGPDIKIKRESEEDDTPGPMTESLEVIYLCVIQRAHRPPTTIEIEDALRFRKPRIERIDNKLRELRKIHRLDSYKDRRKNRLVWVKHVPKPKEPKK